ncbi:hypothetical protein NDU88_002199 [Pleurodeles waltl]|uniref:Uncharacterized protein n=1 Tax=Pleurodeles waltl TaxID=8319 RepID=A0AAV7WNR8_PLEWA|nr:hypothetical protein NDU88_002199 [Pleurodeles waltl]
MVEGGAPGPGDPSPVLSRVHQASACAPHRSGPPIRGSPSGTHSPGVTRGLSASSAAAPSTGIRVRTPRANVRQNRHTSGRCLSCCRRSPALGTLGRLRSPASLCFRQAQGSGPQGGRGPPQDLVVRTGSDQGHPGPAPAGPAAAARLGQFARGHTHRRK